MYYIDCSEKCLIKAYKRIEINKNSKKVSIVDHGVEISGNYE